MSKLVRNYSVLSALNANSSISDILYEIQVLLQKVKSERNCLQFYNQCGLSKKLILIQRLYQIMISSKINPLLNWYFGIRINMDIHVRAKSILTKYGSRMNLRCLLPFKPKTCLTCIRNDLTLKSLPYIGEQFCQLMLHQTLLETHLKYNNT